MELRELREAHLARRQKSAVKDPDVEKEIDIMRDADKPRMRLFVHGCRRFEPEEEEPMNNWPDACPFPQPRRPQGPPTP